jgi:hypothetical protein
VKQAVSAATSRRDVLSVAVVVAEIRMDWWVELRRPISADRASAPRIPILHAARLSTALDSLRKALQEKPCSPSQTEAGGAVAAMRAKGATSSPSSQAPSKSRCLELPPAQGALRGVVRCIGARGCESGPALPRAAANLRDPVATNPPWPLISVSCCHGLRTES